MILLDTDTVTLIGYGDAKVVAKLEASDSAETVAVTLITRMEILRGRFDSVLKAANREELGKAVERMRSSETLLERFEVVYPDLAASEHFERPRTQKRLKMHRADMLNACIALAHDALLVTRNVKDYRGVKDLRVEDWSG